MDSRHLPGVFRISGSAQRHVADADGAVRNPVDVPAFLVHKDQLGDPAAILVGCLQIGHKPQRLFRVLEVLPEQEDPAEMVPCDHFPDFVVQLGDIRFRRLFGRLLPVLRFRHFLPDTEGRDHHLRDLLPQRHGRQQDFQRVVPVVFSKNSIGKQQNNRQNQNHKQSR